MLSFCQKQCFDRVNGARGPVADDRLALDVFIRREDAFAALDDAADEEAQCPRIQFVAPIDLDKLDISTN